MKTKLYSREECNEISFYREFEIFIFSIPKCIFIGLSKEEIELLCHIAEKAFDRGYKRGEKAKLFKIQEVLMDKRDL